MLSFSKKKQYFEDKYKNNVLSYTVLALFNANSMVQKNKKKYQENCSCLFAGVFPRVSEFCEHRVSFFSFCIPNAYTFFPGSVCLCACVE